MRDVYTFLFKIFFLFIISSFLSLFDRMPFSPSPVFSSSLSFRSWSFIGCPGSLFDTSTDWSVRSQRGALNSIGNYFFSAGMLAQTNCTSHTCRSRTRSKCLIRYLDLAFDSLPNSRYRRNNIFANIAPINNYVLIYNVYLAKTWKKFKHIRADIYNGHN